VSILVGARQWDEAIRTCLRLGRNDVLDSDVLPAVEEAADTVSHDVDSRKSKIESYLSEIADLWRQRVTMMEELVAIHGEAYLYSPEGDGQGQLADTASQYSAATFASRASNVSTQRCVSTASATATVYKMSRKHTPLTLIHSLFSPSLQRRLDIVRCVVHVHVLCRGRCALYARDWGGHFSRRQKVEQEGQAAAARPNAVGSGQGQRQIVVHARVPDLHEPSAIPRHYKSVRCVSTVCVLVVCLLLANCCSPRPHVVSVVVFVGS